MFTNLYLNNITVKLQNRGHQKYLWNVIVCEELADKARDT